MNMPRDKLKMGKIVLSLVENLFHTNHHPYMDNFYTSPLLFIVLKARGIHAAGTCCNRKGFPLQQLKAVQLSRRGQVARLTHNSLTALQWKDKKDILLFSSIHNQPKFLNGLMKIQSQMTILSVPKMWCSEEWVKMVWGGQNDSTDPESWKTIIVSWVVLTSITRWLE